MQTSFYFRGARLFVALLLLIGVFGSPFSSKPPTASAQLVQQSAQNRAAEIRRLDELLRVNAITQATYNKKIWELLEPGDPRKVEIAQRQLKQLQFLHENYLISEEHYTREKAKWESAFTADSASQPDQPEVDRPVASSGNTQITPADQPSGTTGPATSTSTAPGTTSADKLLAARRASSDPDVPKPNIPYNAMKLGWDRFAAKLPDFGITSSKDDEPTGWVSGSSAGISGVYGQEASIVTKNLPLYKWTRGRPPGGGTSQKIWRIDGVAEHKSLAARVSIGVEIGRRLRSTTTDIGERLRQEVARSTPYTRKMFAFSLPPGGFGNDLQNEACESVETKAYSSTTIHGCKVDRLVKTRKGFEPSRPTHYVQNYEPGPLSKPVAVDRPIKIDLYATIDDYRNPVRITVSIENSRDFTVSEKEAEAIMRQLIESYIGAIEQSLAKWTWGLARVEYSPDPSDPRNTHYFSKGDRTNTSWIEVDKNRLVRHSVWEARQGLYGPGKSSADFRYTLPLKLQEGERYTIGIKGSRSGDTLEDVILPDADRGSPYLRQLSGSTGVRASVYQGLVQIDPVTEERGMKRAVPVTVDVSDDAPSGENDLDFHVDAIPRKYERLSISTDMKLSSYSTMRVTWIYEKGAAPIELEETPPGIAESPGDAAPIEGKILEVAAWDANPDFLGGKSYENSSSAELIESVSKRVVGCVADGTSRLLLQVQTNGPGTVKLQTHYDSAKRAEREAKKAAEQAARAAEAANADAADSADEADNGDATSGDEEDEESEEADEEEEPAGADGGFSMLFGGRTQEIEGKFYALAVFTPPDTFDDVAPDARQPEERRRVGPFEVRDVYFDVDFTPDNGSEAKRSRLLKLARPPVLLVHGTFSDPKECWQTSAREAPVDETRGSVSMEDYLRARGHAIYLVDYSNSNGKRVVEAIATTENVDNSSFNSNRSVLWTENGIKTALEDFRNQGFAATQVNVVGHSMGGLIARLWASDNYNDGRYRRPSNFGEGDIHRLITLATPHYGSDMAVLHRTIEKAGIRDYPSLNPIFKSIADLGLWFGFEVGSTDALRDQYPQSDALKRIGPSNVPSHAIVCVATAPSLKHFGGLYLKAQQWIWWIYSLQPKTVRMLLEENGQSEQADRLLGEVRRGENGPIADLEGTTLPATGDDIGPIVSQDEVYQANLARQILFGNTPNDMCVRVESQLGGLPLQHTTLENHVVHSFAPRYEHVQQSVAKLLAGPHWRFYKEGFPPAGKKLTNVNSVEVTQDRAERAAAIKASCIVPSHAEAISIVAKERKECIIMRPVNEVATSLILSGYGTKDMHVKGKSSNWGPQQGTIAVDQRFSKLVGQPDMIEEFGKKVVKCLEDKRALAIDLVITVKNVEYQVRVRKGVEDPHEAIVLYRPDGPAGQQWFDWRNDGKEFDFDQPISRPFQGSITLEETEPLQILADRHSRLPLTADYDLLAIGYTKPQPKPNWDPEMGGVTEAQKETIHAINYAVRLRAHYRCGNVSHHGPETNYPGSPGVDYPNTLFSSNGGIYTIKEGPKGAKDQNLKKLFHQLKNLGWNIEPNPVWHWGPYQPEVYPHGYRLNDADIPLLPAKPDPDNYYDSDE